MRCEPADRRSFAEVLARFAAPAARRVQIVRPFSVLSKNTYSAPVAMPIGPAYLAAALQEAGYQVGFVDGVGAAIDRFRPSSDGASTLQGLSVEEIVARIPRDAFAIGVSLMFSQEWPEHRRLIRALHAAFPEAFLIVGGEHVTALTEYVLRDCPEIDYAICGEGEVALLELLHALASGAQPKEIAGLAFLDERGALVRRPSRRLASLAGLPRPAWQLCEVERYFVGHFTMGISLGRNMPVVATRGCPYQCTFCSSASMWSTRYALRPVSEVVDEIAWLVETWGANSIDFYDLTAVVKKSWLMEFCAELERRALQVAWQLPSGTRSEALDEEALAAARKAGCRFLVYAPESGSSQVLRQVNKRISLPRLIESVRAAVRVGHTVKINLIIGFPEETLADVLATLALALRAARLGAHDCNISLFAPYPGSELYEQLRDQGILPEPGDAYFASLGAQFDFTNPSSVCRQVPGTALAAMRVAGYAAFYAASYGLHPARAARLARALGAGRFQASNLFEQRVADALARRRQQRTGSEAAAERG